MLHFRERVPRSWPRRVSPAGKRDASAASSGARRPPGWSFAVRMVSCSPYPGTGRTFPRPLRRPPVPMRDRAQSFSPHRPWSSLYGLYGIMPTSSDLPGWERKEGRMIRALAQIVFRQVCAPKERILEEPDPPPALRPIIGQTPRVSLAGPCASAAPAAFTRHGSIGGRQMAGTTSPSTCRLVHPVGAAPRAGRTGAGGDP